MIILFRETVISLRVEAGGAGHGGATAHQGRVVAFGVTLSSVPSFPDHWGNSFHGVVGVDGPFSQTSISPAAGRGVVRDAERAGPRGQVAVTAHPFYSSRQRQMALTNKHSKHSSQMEVLSIFKKFGTEIIVNGVVDA